MVLAAGTSHYFFGDISFCIVESNRQARIFLDQLTVTTVAITHVSNELAMERLCTAQEQADKWGQRNGVAFDARMETLHITHAMHSDDPSS